MNEPQYEAQARVQLRDADEILRWIGGFNDNYVRQLCKGLTTLPIDICAKARAYCDKYPSTTGR